MCTPMQLLLMLTMMLPSTFAPVCVCVCGCSISFTRQNRGITQLDNQTNDDDGAISIKTAASTSIVVASFNDDIAVCGILTFIFTNCSFSLSLSLSHIDYESILSFPINGPICIAIGRLSIQPN